MFASRTDWKLGLNRFSAALERRRAAGGELLDLTESNPTRCGFNYDPALLSLLADPRGSIYEPRPKGLSIAAEAIAGYYRERGAEVDCDRIIVTAGTSEGYGFIFRLLCNPGDELLVPAPSYPLFEFLASIHDVKLVSYPLIYDHGWQIDLHLLQQAISRRTRAVLVVHPNNPTGSLVAQQEMKVLDELCSERGLGLIADEVFLDYTQAKAASFVGTQRALTFTLSGISKICALPQMKLAWIVVGGSREVATDALARLEVIADTYLSVSTPVQLALPEFLARRHAIQKQLKGRVAANLVELDRQIASHESVRHLAVEGGWYAMLRVPVTRSDEDLAIDLLEQQSVIVHPGHFYDFPGDGHLVVSLIPREPVFAEAIAKLLAFGF